MSQIDAFMPSLAGTQVIAVGNAAATTPIIVATVDQKWAARNGGEFLVFSNFDAAVIIFVEICYADQIVVATATTSFPIGPGKTLCLRRPPGATQISAIASAAGPTNLFVSQGVGTL